MTKNIKKIIMFVVFILLLYFTFYFSKIEKFKSNKNQYINSSLYIENFPFEIKFLYDRSASRIDSNWVCSSFPFPQPQNGDNFRIPGKILTFCMGARLSYVPYYNVKDDEDFMNSYDKYKNGDRFAIPGYEFVFINNNENNNNENNNKIIESFGGEDDLGIFPYSTDILTDNFPMLEDGEQFRIAGFILEFCKNWSERNIHGKLTHYKIIKDEDFGSDNIFNETCFKSGMVFGIPGYILTYQPVNAPIGNYKFFISWKGNEFYDYEKKWNYYKNKTCSLPDMRNGCRFTNRGNYCGEPTKKIEVDNNGDSICCNHRDGNNVCYGEWRNLLSSQNNNLIMKLLPIKNIENINETVLKAVKIESNVAFTSGLFIIDVKHVPIGLTVSGTLCLTNGNDLFEATEINIMDVFNATNRENSENREKDDTYRKNQTQNISSITNYNTQSSRNTGCFQDVPYLIPYTSKYKLETEQEIKEYKQNERDCSNELYGCNSFGPIESSGDVLNRNNGGVFICEWKEVNQIKLWFFKYGSKEYNDLTKNEKEIDTGILQFNKPYIIYNSSCRKQLVPNMKLSLGIDVCGKKASNFFPSIKKEQSSSFNYMPPLTASNEERIKACKKYLKSIPNENLEEHFKDAYWDIRSIRVFTDVDSIGPVLNPKPIVPY